MTETIPPQFTLEIRKQTDVAAPPEVVFDAMIEQITGGMDDGGHGDNPVRLRLELRPGGRYWRDLGDDTGHLWGHVQVIKPPRLLEITGPLFMSAPVLNHVQYRITPAGDGRSTLAIAHRAFGPIDPEHRRGVDRGWQDELDRIKTRSERR